jgi:hypothetical protein
VSGAWIVTVGAAQLGAADDPAGMMVARASAAGRSRRSRTTASISDSLSTTCPSVTAPITARLCSSSSAMVSSIVSGARRYQAVTALACPILWHRSSACARRAGVQSSSRNATFDARVSVSP